MVYFHRTEASVVAHGQPFGELLGTADCSFQRRAHLDGCFVAATKDLRCIFNRSTRVTEGRTQIPHLKSVVLYVDDLASLVADGTRFIHESPHLLQYFGRS